MKIFDSITSSKWDGKGLSLNDGIIVAHRTAKFSQSLYVLKKDYLIKIIGKKRTGNGKINISIVLENGAVIISKSVIFSKNSWTEFSFNFNPGEYKGRIQLEFSRDKTAFGTLEIGRVIVNEIKTTGSGEIKPPIAKIKRYSRNNRIKQTQNVLPSVYIPNETNLFSKKSIAFIVPYGIYGGAEIYIKNIISQVNKDLYDISILYVKKNILETQLDIDFVNHISIININHLCGVLVNNNYDFIIYYNRENIYRALSSLKNEKKIFGSIAEIYHSDFQWAGSLSKVKNRENIDLMFQVAPSLAQDISGIKKNVVVPVGIDLSKFSKRIHPIQDATLSKILENKKYVIGTVARLSKEKNIEYIIDLASVMPDCLFIVIGEGPNRLSLEDKILKLKLDNIHLIGFRNDIHKYYHIFDAFVLSSKIEGTPISIIEAMASGVPVFSNMVGAIPDIIKDGFTGYKIHGDVKTDSKIIMDNFRNNNIIENARKFVKKNHDVKKNSKLFFESLVSVDELYNKINSKKDLIFIKGVYI